MKNVEKKAVVIASMRPVTRSVNVAVLSTTTTTSGIIFTPMDTVHVHRDTLERVVEAVCGFIILFSLNKFGMIYLYVQIVFSKVFNKGSYPLVAQTKYEKRYPHASNLHTNFILLRMLYYQQFGDKIFSDYLWQIHNSETSLKFKKKIIVKLFKFWHKNRMFATNGQILLCSLVNFKKILRKL